MKLPTEAELLRVFIGESDRTQSGPYKGRPLYEAIVTMAREQGLAGATALRGILGFGANSLVHTSKILRLSQDLPVVVEIVDSPDKIKAFLTQLDELITEGLITLERAEVLAYRTKGSPKGSGKDPED